MKATSAAATNIALASTFSSSLFSCILRIYLLTILVLGSSLFAAALSSNSYNNNITPSASEPSSSTMASSSPQQPSEEEAAADANANAKNTIDFLTMARGLKTTPRTGWVLQEAGPRIESVADHSWRIGLMAMVAASSSTSSSSSETTYDTNRCIKMALVHDLAEATVGDITPHCGISEDDKHARELLAITEMTQKLGNLPGIALTSSSPVGNEILELWKEYEEGTTNEANLVKDMDKLEMILQALEYENDGKNKKSLDGFFDSTRDKWRTPIGAAWGKEIESRRRNKKTETTTTKED